MSGSARSVVGMRAVEAVERIRAGALTSLELTGACLEHIERTDPEVRAWTRVDRDAVLGQAKEMDSLRQRGLPLGALHGVPVAVDELFGAPGMPAKGDPTASGISTGDALPAVVERLKEAGAVVIRATRAGAGALAPRSPATSPCDAPRSAGELGGGAAAVGVCQVPLAVTCEPRGGVVVSASFCGVFGFRPTRGIISRRGARGVSPTLDQVGVFGRDLEDVALAADVLGGYDAADEASGLRPRPRMREGLRSTPPVEPDFIWLDMPGDTRLSAAVEAGFEELRDTLGEHVVRLPAPAWFARLPAAHRIIEEHEAASGGRAHDERSSPSLPEMARRGSAPAAEGYRTALSEMKGAREYFSDFFHHYDAVIAPAADGEAPLLESGPGDHVPSRVFALCALPSLCVPLLQGETGLPIGVQLVGSAEGDDRLLRSTAWLLARIRGEQSRD